MGCYLIAAITIILLFAMNFLASSRWIFAPKEIQEYNILEKETIDFVFYLSHRTKCPAFTVMNFIYTRTTLAKENIETFSMDGLMVFLSGLQS